MFDKFFKASGETKNITPKIFAIILAVVLWLYVMNEQNPPIESSFTIPLEVRNVATSYVVVDAPDTVRVKVRGPRSIVAGVLNQDLKAYIDGKGLTEGRHNIKVSAALPASLELVEINPDKIQLRLDTTISRQVPVEVRLSGTPAKGAVVGKVAASHDQVTLEGPKNLVGTVEKVVAVADLSGKNTDFTVGAPLVPVTREGKEVEGLTIYPDKTGVVISLTAGITKKVLDVKPVTQGELPAGLVIKSIVTQPNKVEVRETVPGKGVDKLETIYTEPVDLSNIGKDTDREVKLELQEGLTGTPGTVIVNIRVGPR
ncbi:CdaR family protein [Sporomusa malonica]|uniref:YbbR domain-containing protein n=1 Tax=Sporomusa malonica TaxID=112901 RepID=A0A1W2DJE1_9FIRM|nr:CdaR family protein [Sporomusa malonica]SMC97553.1 YbbR domain-containing protein [Sporomusa malonica]